MRRLLTLPLLAAVAVLLGVASTSCAAVDPPALTVGSWSVSRDELLKQLEEIEALQSPSQVSTSTTDATLQPSFAAQILDIQAQHQLVVQTLAERGQAIDDSDRDVAYALLAQTINQQAQQPVTGDAVRSQGAQLFGPLEDEVVDQQAGLVALARGAGSLDVLVAEAYEAQKQEVTCISAIVLTPAGPPTAAGGGATGGTTTTLAAADVEAEARSLKQQLDAGADFAGAARANSVLRSAATGGNEGCNRRGDLPPALDAAVWAAGPGDITDAISIGEEGQPAWAVVKVDRRYTPALDEVRDQLEPVVLQRRVQEVKAELVADAFRDIPVSVDPLFGVWVEESLRVQPPPGAAVPSTTTSLLAGGGVDLSGLGLGAPSGP